MTSNVEPVRDGQDIIAPKTVSGPDDLVGDAWVILSPGDPDYDMWDRYLRTKEGGAARRPGGGR